MSSETLLRIFYPALDTEVHTNASQNGISATLLQYSLTDGKLHPVQHMSRKSQPTERKYKSYELKILAVIETLEKFHVYLLGLRFKIVTDCAAFTQTMRKKEVLPKIWRWAERLENFVLEHRPDVRMKHVDVLSRNAVMIIVEDSIVAKIKVVQTDDSNLNELKKALELKFNDEYTLSGDIRYKFDDGRDLLVVSDSMQDEIIRLIHQKSQRKERKMLSGRNILYQNLKKQIEKFIANYISCILANRKQGRLEGQLYPLPKDNVPLHTYHIDYLGLLESISKKYHILMVIDSFTKFT